MRIQHCINAVRLKVEKFRMKLKSYFIYTLFCRRTKLITYRTVFTSKKSILVVKWCIFLFDSRTNWNSHGIVLPFIYVSFP